MTWDPSAAASDGDAVEVRRVQLYQATKRYVCPGCNQDIPAGTGHLVVVPRETPDLRRHWHHACWSHRHCRKPGRRKPGRRKPGRRN